MLCIYGEVGVYVRAGGEVLQDRTGQQTHQIGGVAAIQRYISGNIQWGDNP